MMDEQYAKLSLFAGLFAGSADWHLGYPHFVRKIHAHAWDLTIEKLAEWKMEAVRLGVPTEALDPTEEQLRAMPELVQIGLQLQQDIDRMTGYDKKEKRRI